MLPNRSHVSAFKRTDVDLSIDAGLVVGRNREVLEGPTSMNMLVPADYKRESTAAPGGA